MAEECSSWDLVSDVDLWESGDALDQEGYVVVKQEDIVDGIACFMAAYLLSLKETKVHSLWLSLSHIHAQAHRNSCMLPPAVPYMERFFTLFLILICFLLLCLTWFFTHLFFCVPQWGHFFIPAAVCFRPTGAVSAWPPFVHHTFYSSINMFMLLKIWLCLEYE